MLAQLPQWRQILSQNFTLLEPLVQFLELDDEQRKLLLRRPPFALNVPKRLAHKMTKRTLDDPLLRQFVPLVDEQNRSQGYCMDPVGDTFARTAPKLLHKYQGRVLLVATSTCAMHCRYCFRQNFDYATEKSFATELDSIGQEKSVREVILSGGDPLSLSNAALRDLLQKLYSFNHIRTVRFHTRFPLGIPERIDEELLDLLSSSPVQIVMVIHSNHPREFDADVLTALRSLRQAGALLLNQSVLLRGVNDSLETLVGLSQLLVDNGILPYYLHQLDKVQGAAHFEVKEEIGHKLIEEMRKRLPGYAIPTYVREDAGEPHKTIL